MSTESDVTTHITRDILGITDETLRTGFKAVQAYEWYLYINDGNGLRAATPREIAQFLLESRAAELLWRTSK